LPEYPREYAGPDSIAIGDWIFDAAGRRTAQFTPYATIGQVFRATYIYGGATTPVQPTPFAGFYGLDGRVSLLIAAERGMDGAAEALQWLEPQIAANLRGRAGWNLAGVEAD